MTSNENDRLGTVSNQEDQLLFLALGLAAAIGAVLAGNTAFLETSLMMSIVTVGLGFVSISAIAEWYRRRSKQRSLYEIEEGEFTRDEFELEFDSLDDLDSWMEHRGRAITCRRVRVGEFVVQVAPHADDCSVQIAHWSYKGNTARDSDD